MLSLGLSDFNSLTCLLVRSAELLLPEIGMPQFPLIILPCTDFWVEVQYLSKEEGNFFSWENVMDSK